MKIQCDVCSAAEASVFCCADEAALCDACDRRVHHANKLASKHCRLSLLHPNSPSPPPPPLCDLCQTKRAFLFCKEDRAILCSDCDASIHGANQLTMKHSRFLLTGVRLSFEPIGSGSGSLEGEVVPDISSTSQINQEKPSAVSKEEVLCTNSGSTATATNSNSNSDSSSSISEYLIKMLPGWHVEDLLFDDASPNFSYQMDEMMNPFMESSAGAAVDGLPQNQGGKECYHYGLVGREADIGEKVGRRRSEDVFMVPQFQENWSSNKRHRPSYLW